MIGDMPVPAIFIGRVQVWPDVSDKYLEVSPEEELWMTEGNGYTIEYEVRSNTDCTVMIEE